MAAYCNIDDVYKIGVHGGTTYTETSTPTEDQVEAAIERIYRDINSKLHAAGVVIPVDETDSPIAYALLTDLNAVGASAAAEAISFNENSRENPEKGYTPSFFQKDYDKKLKLYTDLPLSYLIDVETTGLERISDTHDGGIIMHTLQDKYDHAYVQDKEEGSIKPAFRMDDTW